MIINILFVVGLSGSRLEARQIMDVVFYLMIANITYTITVTDLERIISSDIKAQVDLQAFGTGFALQKLRDLRCCGQDTAHAPVLFPCCASSCPVWTDPVDAGPLRNSLSGDCKRHGILLIFYHWMPFFLAHRDLGD